MRPVLPGDLDLAVRVLLAAPRARWADLARALIAAARTGAAHRARHGRGHRRYGSGSIAAAAAAFERAPLPDSCTPAYLAALRVVAQEILRDAQCDIAG